MNTKNVQSIESLANFLSGVIYLYAHNRSEGKVLKKDEIVEMFANSFSTSLSMPKPKPRFPRGFSG